MPRPPGRPSPQQRTWLAVALYAALGSGACVGGSLTGGGAQAEGNGTTPGDNDAPGTSGSANDGNGNSSTAGPGSPNAGNAPGGGNTSSGANPNDGNAAPPGPAEVSSEGDGNYTVGTSFTVDPNLAGLLDGNPGGKWTTFYVPGANSNYFTGQMKDVPGLKQSVTINRQVQVFVPAQYEAGALAPLLVLMDGGDFQYTLKWTLPNLIAQGALPPLVAITVSAGSYAGTYNERSWEYDVVSTRWSDYVENEILPLVEQKAGIRLTKNPALRGVMGGSSGGSAGMTMVWLHPDRYTRAVLFSASLVKLWPTDGYPDGSWFYPAGAVANAERKNLRLSLTVGQNDLNAGSGGMTDWRLANQKTAAALVAKGYHTRFTTVKGGGHESPDALKQTTPTELAWAWRGWQQATP